MLEIRGEKIYPFPKKKKKTEWIHHVFVAFFPINPYKYFMKLSK